MTNAPVERFPTEWAEPWERLSDEAPVGRFGSEGAEAWDGRRNGQLECLGLEWAEI
ncbi:MAG: hypothetical protein AAF813_02985 [Pseudomonadota bacterium]